MKKFLFLFLSIVSLNLFAQENGGTAAFSKFRFFTYGGVNFNSVPTIGGSVYLGVKTNLSSAVNLSFTAGYSSVFDDNPYMVKTYGISGLDGNAYYTKDVSVEKVEYAAIPFTMGLEYAFASEKFIPFVSVEAGFSLNTVEERIASRTYHSYPSLDDIPGEYKEPPNELYSDSFLIVGAGAGIEYKISESFGLRFKYVFNYNDGIPNTNQFLVGVFF